MGLLRFVTTLPLKVRSLFRRAAVETDFDDEMRDHIEAHTAQLIARGMTPDVARTEAVKAMGGVLYRKDQLRDTLGFGRWDQVVADVKYAGRRLARSPGFTLVTIVTLALGLGANTAIFTIVNGVLLRPLAYRDPSRLVTVSGTVAPADFLDWRNRNRSFESMGAAQWWSPALLQGDRPEQIKALHVTADIFTTMGVPPMLGRLPRLDEEHTGSAPVVVIGYEAWRRRFSGDSGVIGRSVSFDGVPHTIIGVMPDSFHFAPYWATTAEVWAPLVLDARVNDREGSSLRVFGRLRPAVDVASAREDLAGIVAGVSEGHAAWAKRFRLVPLRALVVEDVDAQLTILQAAVLLLLCIACANVAHLLLMRAAATEQQSAVRVALGASPGRIIQQALIESGILCLSGAIAGLGLGYAAIRLFVRFAPPELPRVDAVRLDARVFLIVAGLALVATLLCGLAPAIRLGRAQAGDALRSSRGSNDTARRRRIRNALVVSELALTFLLLAGAGMVWRSFHAMLQVDPGFEQGGTVQMEIALKGSAHEGRGQRAQFYLDLADRMRQLPGVQSAAYTNHIPIQGDHWNIGFAVEGNPPAAPGNEPHALFRLATPGYFGAIGIVLRSGRDFTDTDLRNGSAVALVNTTMAQKYWPGVSPIGRRFTADDPAKGPEWFTVIGVVGDVRAGRWVDEPPSEMYFPYESNPDTGRGFTLRSLLLPDEMTLVIRTGGDPGQVIRAAQDLVHAADRDVVVANASTLAAIVETQFVTPRFYLWLVGMFAFVALALAAVGTYGVISYSVAQRTRELGVRAALGADQSDSVRLVMGQGLLLVVIGGTIGLALSMVTMRFAQSLLFQVKPIDPLSLGAAYGVLAIVAAAASYLPAKRAAGVDPMIALRAE